MASWVLKGCTVAETARSPQDPLSFYSHSNRALNFKLRRLNPEDKNSNVTLSRVVVSSCQWDKRRGDA